MSLLEINKAFEGKGLSELAKKQYQVVENLEEKVESLYWFMETYRDIEVAYRSTESAREFYSLAPDVKKVLGDDAEEVFYTAKLGYSMEGAPARLVYILQKALRKYDMPNVAISSIPESLLTPFIGKGAIGEGITIKHIVQNILGHTYESLLKSKLAAYNNDAFEVYVADVDRVIILPKEYEDVLKSLSDLQTVCYDKVKGVCMCGMPFRTMKGHYGITEDEFDLRRCI